MANAAIELSRSNRASFKKKAIAKYKKTDKKKLLKKAALYTGGAAATAGAVYGAHKWGSMSKMQKGRALVKARRAPGSAASAVRDQGSKAMKAARMAKEKAKFAASPKGLSWHKKGVSSIKAGKSRRRKIAATKVMHPKHWRRYVKAEGYDFTRDDLIEAIVEELLSR